MGHKRRNSTWKALLSGLLVFFACDALVFRTGLYVWIAEPNSNAGGLMRRVELHPVYHPPVAQPTLLLLGDSRMGEGCVPAQMSADLQVPRDSVQLASVPGSTPRVQSFVCEMHPRPRGGFTFVIVGLPTFDDDGIESDLAQRALDLAFLAPVLSPDEAWTVAGEFESFERRRDIVLAAICRSFAWRHDIADLLSRPKRRLGSARRDLWWLAGAHEYEGRTESIEGVHVQNGSVVGIDDPIERDKLQRLIRRGSGFDNSAYNRRWLGRIADQVAADGGELVLLRMPTQVLPRLEPRVPSTGVIDELARRPSVHVLDHDLFAELEAPRYFFDALHLNRAGATRFTRILVDELRRRFPEQLGR